MMANHLRRVLVGLVVIATMALSGCSDWRGLNSISLPGTVGGGPGSYTIQAQLPEVVNLQPNSRVRVGDVTVGNITKIERQGWHALITMTIDGKVDLPAILDMLETDKDLRIVMVELDSGRDDPLPPYDAAAASKA